MKNWKKYFIIGVIGLASLFGLKKDSGNSFEKSLVNVISGIGKEYNISRDIAEKELFALSKRAYMEDSWAYVRDKLVDNGECEDKMQVKPKIDYLDSLIKDENLDTIYLYHIHSRRITKGINPPSLNDLVNHAKRKKHFAEKGCYIVSKVFDGYGVWIYDTDDFQSEMLTKINKHGLPFGYLNLNFQLNTLGHTLANNRKLSKKEKIEDYIQGSKELGFENKFKSLN